MRATTAPRSVRTVGPRLTLRGVLDRLATLNARYRDRRHLARLDDRTLRDIGLTRADVAEELRRPIRW